MDQYDAFLGHPDAQAFTVRPFNSIEERQTWAKQNQALYGAFLRWSSIRSNLELSQLASALEVRQLQVHYTFLSAFTHATKSGYEVGHRRYLNSPPASHTLGELVILCVAAIAVSELKSWATYIERRPKLLEPLRSDITDLASRAGDVIAYFWFLGGYPQPFDYCQEANRRAHPMPLSGLPPDVNPSRLRADDVGYYDHPFDRLQRMHTGEREITTGFGSEPAWPSLHW